MGLSTSFLFSSAIWAESWLIDSFPLVAALSFLVPTLLLCTTVFLVAIRLVNGTYLAGAAVDEGVVGADFAFEDFSTCVVSLGLKLELFTNIFVAGLDADECTTTFREVLGGEKLEAGLVLERILFWSSQNC